MCIGYCDNSTVCSRDEFRSGQGKGALQAMSVSAACFGHVRSSKVLGGSGVTVSGIYTSNWNQCEGLMAYDVVGHVEKGRQPLTCMASAI